MPILLLDAMRRQTPMSFLFIDIDHFKRINDNYGHETGDAALIAVANAMQSCLHRPLDFLCRWGGEEFVVLLSDTAEVAAISLANSMMQAVSAIKLADTSIKITISIGVKTVLITPDNLHHDHLNDVEEAMMLAKKYGRNQYVVFDQNQAC